MKRLTGCALVAFVLQVTGCSGGDAGRAAVAGKVTRDGQPVEEGRSEFWPEASNPGATAGSAITSGAYAVPRTGGAVIGKNRVKIYANKKTGKKIPNAYGGTTDETVQAIPPKYNEKSDLVRDIQSGANPLDFDLQSK